ncbi:GGDEF domain-containing protein, partial [Acinetobacter baumannii]
HAAATDPLTGLPNRMTFSRQMTEAFERARRLHSTFGIVAIDLDHFKAINDGYGHKAGDDVLIAVAKALSREVRASDLCARLGG